MMFFKQYGFFKNWTWLLVFCFSLSACEMFWSPKSPKGYVVPKPEKMILEKKLNEISGLFYMPEENIMLAVADNKQKIYRVTPDGKVDDYFEDDFGPEADYEDVVQVDSAFYVLISNGTIVEIVPGDSSLNVKS